MAQPIEEFLLEAIQKDDKKAFDALMEKTQCGGYRLGRFPVLSLMYLYKSGKIISAYEEKFIKITAWEALREPASIAKTFSDKAGKCLRLYLSEVVSPLEMLLILDETRRLKRVYPLTKASSAVKDRLQSIYSVKYSLGIKYEGNDIILDKRPLSKKEKKKIVTVCVSVALAVAIAVATPVTIVSLVPHRADGEVTKLKHIDFEKATTYTLESDITIPANYGVEEMNCTIVGNGKKLIFEKGATIKTLNGKISDAEILSYGSPLFDTVTEKAEISSVNLNVTADISTTKSTALIALTNYGLLDEVNVSVSGKISALAGDSDGTTELNFGGLVLNNAIKYNSFGNMYYGIIRNSTVNYSSLVLDGEVYANGVFAGIVGTNSGAVGNITVTGSVTSDTFDLAGVCSTNIGRLTEIVNEATLSQVSESEQWNPIVCGIVTENYGTVDYCENRGALSSKSDCGQTEEPLTVSVSGIVYSNRGQVGVCTNKGDISAEGKGYAVVGGIAATNYYGIYYCRSSGDITVKAENVRVGGMFGESLIPPEATTIYSVTWGFADHCISECNISVTASGEYSFVGGIAGYIMQGSVTGLPNDDGSVNILGYFGGGVTNSFFTGSVSADNACIGNIIGATGKNIYYGTELYFEDYVNLENNYYIDEGVPACGATRSTDDEGNDIYEEATENVGATVSTIEDIKQNGTYLSILEEFGDLNSFDYLKF